MKLNTEYEIIQNGDQSEALVNNYLPSVYKFEYFPKCQITRGISKGLFEA
jgi:hypothetical protein